MSFREKPDGSPRLVSVATYLSADNEGPLGETATILHHNRIAHLGAAMDSFRQSAMEPRFAISAN